MRTTILTDLGSFFIFPIDNYSEMLSGKGLQPIGNCSMTHFCVPTHPLRNTGIDHLKMSRLSSQCSLVHYQKTSITILLFGIKKDHRYVSFMKNYHTMLSQFLSWKMRSTYYMTKADCWALICMPYII